MKKNIIKIYALLTASILALSGCGNAAESAAPTTANETGANAGYTADNYDSAPSHKKQETPAAAEKADNSKNEANGAVMPEYEYSDSAEEYIDYIEEPAEPPVNSEEYSEFTENAFLSVKEAPLSTFSADVDTASYTNIRRLLNDGMYVPEDSVRIEEILNYFSYEYPDPNPGEPFSVTTELSACPWNADHQLMLVGIKADDMMKDDHIASNLVFLIDVSGSMSSPDKLPLVQTAFNMLADRLDENDRISIVTYAGSDSVLLDGEPGSNKNHICDVIDSLESGGSTAGAAGIITAYDIASRNFIEGGNNRIILATDGDLNVGPSSVNELTALVENERDKGIFLSVLGFGSGNYKDDRLEALADNGNGNYSYIDCISEAKKVLVDEMSSTLVTVAKDVKFQVEFNPANVSEYRLIGYENRALANRDFNDDTKDAGEVGAGSTVTVLYEIVPADAADDYTPEFRYSDNEKATMETEPAAVGEHADELLTVNIRCKAPDADESKLYVYPVRKSIYQDRMPKNLNFAACCAEFGMLLRHSRYSGTSSYERIMDMLKAYNYEDDEYKAEFGLMVRLASRM